MTTVAHRVEDGREVDIPLEDVAVGDSLRIRPGENVPVDGAVVDLHEGPGGINAEVFAQVDEAVFSKRWDELAGGGGAVAAVSVKAAPADGHSLVLASTVPPVQAMPEHGLYDVAANRSAASGSRRPRRASARPTSA